jgi:peptidoglycan hydrolase-like protein with peptidoglycan-binding domain
MSVDVEKLVKFKKIMFTTIFVLIAILILILIKKISDSRTKPTNDNNTTLSFVKSLNEPQNINRNLNINSNREELYKGESNRELNRGMEELNEIEKAIPKLRKIKKGAKKSNNDCKIEEYIPNSAYLSHGDRDSPNSKAGDVRKLQNFLYAYGVLSKRDINGRFDGTTLFAVKRFQKIYGLPADGIVGPKTIYLMNKIYSGCLD